MAKEIADEYASSLSDLTVNSKPLINMLTILAEENIEHAGVIVETVEKHLEKVSPDIKLPVLYLVDSIIKNVGGAYTQKFAQSIVNMFTKTFKQVDEKVRSQMFKLRETWHEVLPSTKLYQLDVKVNLIDPAWPIQAHPQQSNIHVNPNFLKKPAPATSTTTLTPEEEQMRSIVAKKEQELLMLQRKKVEMELEQTRRQLKIAEKTGLIPNVATAPIMPGVVGAPVAMVSPVPALNTVVPVPDNMHIPAKQRLGPPVNKVAGAGRIAPVSGALAAARRDPRLSRRAPPPRPAPPVAAPPVAATPVAAPPVSIAVPQMTPVVPPIAPNVFDIKPLERGVTKRKNVITIDVRPEARDPRQPRDRSRIRKRAEKERKEKEHNADKPEKVDKSDKSEQDKKAVDAYIDRLQIADSKKINKLPPIPKKVREEKEDPPTKKKKEDNERKKKREKDSSSSSPEKRSKTKEKKVKLKESVEVEEKPAEPEVVAFKELKNYHKERYMRRNKEKSESPETVPKEDTKTADESKNIGELVAESKDVDLRVLPPPMAEVAAPIAQKRPSTETVEGKVKKHKVDKFDILFGNEDVDLRQLPQVEETPPPPSITANDASDNEKDSDPDFKMASPVRSPKKDWNEVKEKEEKTNSKKTPSKLDLVRAKLAEATKGKERIGRPLHFSKSPSIERDRRRTISSEDIDLRSDKVEDFDAQDHKKTISIIMNQAKEQYNDGQMDKNQYNTLMYQVLQLSEKLKLKEAKQRESLEVSKRKLNAHIENSKVPSPKSSPSDRNNFGDIDERVLKPNLVEPSENNFNSHQDSDMRIKNHGEMMEPVQPGFLPVPPMMPVPPFMGPYPMWRGQPGMRMEEFGPRRFRGPNPMGPFYRGKFDKRMPRLPFDPRMAMPLPTPKLGMCQGESPLRPYERSITPPPLGAPGYGVPPTDFKILEYIDQDPVKTIQIDGIPREIRFYGETAVIMLDWDDPREIKFLPGCRRVTFDNKDSIVLNFNEGYKQVEIDDQVFDIRFGAPTREMYINGRWYECYFGGQPVGVIIDGKPRLVHLEGPLPQVDIGKIKRTDLVAGKINLIIDATQICPVYLDAKVQKFQVDGQFYTIRFVDCLRTVLINEQPFKVEFGDLPKPIFIGSGKHFVRFSALPKNIKPGQIQIANMEGTALSSSAAMAKPVVDAAEVVVPMEVNEDIQRPQKSPSPEGVSQGLNMLASLMPTSMAPASSSEYSSAEPIITKSDKIPGLETPSDEKPANSIPLLGNINVNDLFAKLVATGIVPMAKNPKSEPTVEPKREEPKAKSKEDKSVIQKVDLLKPETLRVKQPGVVARLYGGMQCSGCGARFPPEHTVRYSQHLDWHFRQNRRERDSARRAHSRRWHYDLPDWLQYEEIEDLEEREKSWFETGEGGSAAATTGEGSAPASPPGPSAWAPAAQHHCALCGDRFQQFYNEDHDEWHLRNSVRHNDKYYHPLCLEDYKASQAKEEPAEESVVEVAPEEKTTEAIEIKDAEDADESDAESVVEVIEPEKQPDPEPVEIELEDEADDDVVLKAEPVEQLDVDDDDTDDETAAARADRDRLVDFTAVKIKQEPVDPDDEPVITAEEEPIIPIIETVHKTVMSSIDGNVQLESAPPTTLPLGGIRINISKALPTLPLVNDQALEDVSADEEPAPPGEETELEYKLKPSLEGVHFSRQPPVQKGTELSGLCSIM
ncbi:pre-mRNA cleavage complex 2 protein Pcf11 isoform X2 [Aricia agestis]|uniref:pre-mRNA cleavage complex 2 protein Pcf11 isoform X2 n=1 Tax=Aricia agestis TaxID=91739 RepID=UPI001C2078B5|nr:pre-mRNA cleavage complex 2 protein Pcf11 isoform X2 [Aricia agestis]